MENIPLYLPLAFAATTALSVYLFFRATHKSYTTLYLLCGWLAVQTILGLAELYRNDSAMPPRLLFALSIPVLVIVVLFTTKKGRLFLDRLDTKILTLLHVVRIPVEFVLLGLYLNKAIPQIMTFEGNNFDILSGISAVVIYYFGYVKNVFNKNILLMWNFICLGLLFNIVGTAILCLPSPFQQLAFDQPNIGVLYFPYVWLPSCVVPLVLFSHLVSIRRLLVTSGAKIALS